MQTAKSPEDYATQPTNAERERLAANLAFLVVQAHRREQSTEDQADCGSKDAKS